MTDTNQDKKVAVIWGLKPGQTIEVPLHQLYEHLNLDDCQSLAEMAALSSNVYKDNNQDFFEINNWSAVEIDVSHPTPSWKFKVPGLKFEVWKKSVSGHKPMIAIVFRGSHVGWDWYTNIRWLTRFIPFTFDHYDQTKSIVSKIEGQINGRYGINGVEIVTTGHSLGGGLAQLTAYASQNIKRVFSFDSSPVTGFYDIEKAVRERNKVGTTIYRVYEHREALSFIRNFMKHLYPVSLKDPHIIEIRFNFSGENAIEKHSIDLIARNLNQKI